ncbi:unnamed protein product, partial [Tuber aestivum]
MKFAEWEFTKKQESLHHDLELVKKIKELWARNLSSTNILRCLQYDGWHLSPTQLKNLRLHPDLRLLIGTAHTPEARLEAAIQAETYVREHLISGQAIQYGRQYTLNNIRLMKYLLTIFNFRHQIQAAMKTVDPEGVAERGRFLGNTRERREFSIKGPNRILSIYGHDKLSRFGFEIYGAIDAYSRYIVWCYVGISNRTAVSVNKQYLCLLRTTLHMPKVIRSDKGDETVLLAESHLSLRRANHPDLPFEKAYSYGKSTKNQRIEAWWNILTEGQTQAWKVYFAQLESDGYFNGGDLDKSCLQFLYMKIIRSHIHRFVEIHNSHPIRLQRKREHYLPTGQPFLLYYYPESGKDYKEKVNESLLAALEAEVSEFDLDEYLPISTLALYQGFLDEGGYPDEFSYSDPHHREAYLYLRDRVSDYI